MSGHGGRRAGSGRPRKWELYDDVLRVGQACEAEWRKACEVAKLSNIAALPFSDEIRMLQEEARLVDVQKRAEWLKGDRYEELRGDLETFLHKRTGTHFDEKSATFAREARRGLRVSTKPPKGTRIAIISKVAETNGLSDSQVDSLWQAYRRFERGL